MEESTTEMSHGIPASIKSDSSCSVSRQWTRKIWKVNGDVSQFLWESAAHPELFWEVKVQEIRSVKLDQDLYGGAFSLTE